jgi:phosphopantothenoylcysteine decarboxylase/phosphopantothenate--cysteine ligase
MADRAGRDGGIGAYKAVEVARGLQKRGHEVVAVMTHSATRFVGPVTFEAITRRRVITDQFEPAPTPTSSTSPWRRPSTCS